jgi:tetratricopeptide (TPR) repeat protein
VSTDAGQIAGVYDWEQAKRSSDQPRPLGALLEPHARADEDLQEREAQLRSEVAAAERSDDARSLCKARHYLGLHLEIAGALEVAEESLSAATSASESEVPAAARAAALNDQGVLLLRLGQTREADDLLGQATELAQREQRQDLANAVQRNRGIAAWASGKPEEGLELWNTAFRLGREADEAAGNGQILNNVAILRLLQSEATEAMQLFNRAILLAQRGGDIRTLAFTYNNLGLVFSGHTRGDHFAAVPFMEMALALLTGPVDVLGRLYVLNNNIIVYEQAHLEPARKFRAQFSETLKSFHSSFPQRGLDVERIAYSSHAQDPVGDGAPADDEWEIASTPVLLGSCSRCGPQEE